MEEIRIKHKAYAAWLVHVVLRIQLNDLVLVSQGGQEARLLSKLHLTLFLYCGFPYRDHF